MDKYVSVYEFIIIIINICIFFDKYFKVSLFYNVCNLNDLMVKCLFNCK